MRSRRARSTLRQLGALLLISGVVSILYRVIWRGGANAFNDLVGWSNIAGAVIGAIGLAIVVADRASEKHVASSAKLSETTESLSNKNLEVEGSQLGQLLATDELDSRPAMLEFEDVSRSGETKAARKRKRQGARRVVSLDNLADFYLRKTPGKLIISGRAGAGKTVAALRIVRDLSLRRKQDSSIAVGGVTPTPVIFNLPSWPAGIGLEEWLAEDLSNRFDVARNISRELVSKLYILPILDGLDEMGGDGAKSADRVAAALKEINRYVAVKVAARVVITCRNDSQVYRGSTKALRGFSELKIKRLGLEQVVDYIESCQSPGSAAQWKIVEKELAQHGSSLLAALDLPWRLTMVVSYLNSGGDALRLLPLPDDVGATQGLLFDRYIGRIDRILYSEFVWNKSLHYGRRPDDVLFWLQQITRIVLRAHERNVDDAATLTLPTWWKTVGDHKVVNVQLWGMWGLGHLAWIPTYFLPSSKVYMSGWTGFLDFLCNYALVYVMAYNLVTRMREPREMTLGVAKTFRGIVALLISLIASVGLGTVAYISMGPIYGLIVGISILMAGVVAVCSLPWNRATARSPLSAVRNDMAHGLLIALALAGIMGPNLYSIFGMHIGVFFASAYFLTLAGSSVAAKYYAAVFYAKYRYGLPLRFARFLEWGHSAGLLRVSGVSYQFRHDGLLKYLSREARDSVADGA